MKDRMKNFISNAKDEAVAWWCEWGLYTLVALLTVTTVKGVDVASYWKGRYDGVIENQKH